MDKFNINEKMKRTKIITTIGPSTHSPGAIEELFKTGMTTIRLNFHMEIMLNKEHELYEHEKLVLKLENQFQCY